MARKTAGTLEEQRDKIKATYRRGKRAKVVIVAEDTLSEIEVATKKEQACFLKAADYSFTYIAEALGLKKSVVKAWFEDQAMRNHVAEIQTYMLDGAVKLLRSYAIELVEMLVEIARTADDKVALAAITEGLDRMGMSKVNKSESVTAQTLTERVEITDTTGIIEKLKDAPPEVQQAAAESMERLMSLAAEFSDGGGADV